MAKLTFVLCAIALSHAATAETLDDSSVLLQGSVVKGSGDDEKPRSMAVKEMTEALHEIKDAAYWKAHRVSGAVHTQAHDLVHAHEDKMRTEAYANAVTNAQSSSDLVHQRLKESISAHNNAEAGKKRYTSEAQADPTFFKDQDMQTEHTALEKCCVETKADCLACQQGVNPRDICNQVQFHKIEGCAEIRIHEAKQGFPMNDHSRVPEQPIVQKGAKVEVQAAVEEEEAAVEEEPEEAAVEEEPTATTPGGDVITGMYKKAVKAVKKALKGSEDLAVTKTKPALSAEDKIYAEAAEYMNEHPEVKEAKKTIVDHVQPAVTEQKQQKVEPVSAEKKQKVEPVQKVEPISAEKMQKMQEMKMKQEQKRVEREAHAAAEKKAANKHKHEVEKKKAKAAKKLKQAAQEAADMDEADAKREEELEERQKDAEEGADKYEAVTLKDQQAKLDEVAHEQARLADERDARKEQMEENMQALKYGGNLPPTGWKQGAAWEWNTD